MSTEPHMFHEGKGCFAGCPAWDSKINVSEEEMPGLNGLIAKWRARADELEATSSPQDDAAASMCNVYNECADALEEEWLSW
jgi:hypothetical protein